MEKRNNRIHLGSDHAGWAHKEKVRQILSAHDYQVVDYGAVSLESDDDYPDYIIPAVRGAMESDELAIVFGGSGQGEAIAANKVMGARAVVYYGGPEEILTLSKKHNNANVLSIGARFVEVDSLEKVIMTWLGESFTDEPRHLRRLMKITNYER